MKTLFWSGLTLVVGFVTGVVTFVYLSLDTYQLRDYVENMAFDKRPVSKE